MTEQPLYCPICKEKTTLLTIDDVNTHFYKCEKGHRTLKALNQQEKSLTQAAKIQAEQNRETYVPKRLEPFVNEKGVFKPALVAQWAAVEHHFRIDRQTEILYYGDPKTQTWKTKGETYLEEILANTLGEDNSKAVYVNVLHDLKGVLGYTDIVFSRKIAVENGLLDVETLEFTQPTLKEMVCYQIPVKYDPAAKKLDNWLEFLKQVANPEDLPLLQEWFGYCLLPDYRFHKALWIHGEGRNGKGVFDRTIQGILGKNNVSSIGLEELDGNHRFALSQLVGKLYNTCSEPVSNKIFRTEIFQKVTGADLIKAELKGKNDRLEFVNCAKTTIIGNKFPRIDSPTTAFKDRMMFVKFPNYFDDKARVVNLENVWLNDPEQKSSVFNWALDGLQKLLSQGYFTQTKTQKETEIEFNRVSNPAGAFIMEMGIIARNQTTTRAENLEAYQDYCEGIGVNADAKALTQAMQRLSPKVRDKQTRVLGKKERVWEGFGLKNSDSLEQMEHLEQQKTLRQIDDNEYSKDLLDKTRVPSGASVPKSSKRTCFVECVNYRQSACPAPNYGMRDGNSEVPLGCTGYRARIPGDDA